MFTTTLLLTLITAQPTAQLTGDPTKLHRIVALLDYVGADYPRAVVGGKVISQPEYEEQVMVAGLAKAAVAELENVPAELTRGLDELERACHAIAPGESVAELAKATRRRAVEFFGISQSPSSSLSYANGVNLYAANCAVCHGLTGVPPADKLATLRPPPRVLADREIKNHLSPYQVYNALTFGVTGTAMPAFDSLPPSDRWDLAFYVLSLRADAAAQVALVPIAMRTSTVALSTSSDRELRDRLKAAAVEPAAIEPALDAMRIVVPYLQGALRDLAAARKHLRESIALLDRGERAIASSRALEAYASSYQGAAETIRVLDPTLASSIQADFMTLRAEIDDDDHRAAHEARARLDRSLDRAEMLLGVEKKSNSTREFIFATAGLAAILGSLLILVRPRRSRQAPLAQAA